MHLLVRDGKVRFPGTSNYANRQLCEARLAPMDASATHRCAKCCAMPWAGPTADRAAGNGGPMAIEIRPFRQGNRQVIHLMNYLTSHLQLWDGGGGTTSKRNRADTEHHHSPGRIPQAAARLSGLKPPGTDSGDPLRCSLDYRAHTPRPRDSGRGIK
jgi:hypothetical protein